MQIDLTARLQSKSQHAIPYTIQRISLLILLVCAFLALSKDALYPTRASAQSAIPPAEAHTLNTILVVGEGRIQVEPDIAQVNIGVEIVDPSIQTATSTVRDIVQQILATLEGHGVAANDVQTRGYSVNVERNSSMAPPPPASNTPADSASNAESMQVNYRVMNQLHVVVHDLENLGAILDAAIEAGANNIYGINFLREDLTPLESTTREQALADAQAKAEELAQLAGVELGSVVSISELVGSFGFAPPLPFGMAAAAVPVAPGQVEVAMQLQVTYAISDASQSNTPLSGPDASSSNTASVSVSSAAPVTATQSLTETTSITDSHAAGVTDTNAIRETVTLYGGDENTLRNFLRQYLISPFVTGEENATALYIGTLPPDLPFTLEVPTDMSTVGSIVTTGGRTASTQILFKQEQDVSENINALRRQMEDLGYSRIASSPSQEIFQTHTGDYIPLCSPDGTQAVIVNGRNLPDGTGIVRIYINYAGHLEGPCGVPATSPYSEYDDIMPSLTAPANVSTFSSGSSSSGDSLEASVGFMGDTTIVALAEHYNRQLEAAGWQPLGASQTDDIAWSGWSVKDGDATYTATFYILRDAGANDRFRASLRVQLAR